MQQWYQCPYCSAPVSQSLRFCANCGKKLSWPEQPQTQPALKYYCPHCSAPVPSGAQVCQQCKAQLYWSGQQQTQYIPPQEKSTHRNSTVSQSSSPLKKAGLIILGILLFLSLSLFGPAFLVKQTVLNPDFVSTEVNKLEIGSLAQDMLFPRTSTGIAADINTALSSLVTEIEPQVKEELTAFIRSIYDYLLGKRQNPDISMALRSTFLNADFIGKVIDKLDTASLVKPVIQSQLSSLIPQQMSFLTAIIEPAVDKVIQDAEPLIKEQLKAGVDPIADYLVGARSSFTVNITTEPIIAKLNQTLLQTIMESELPQLTGLSQAMIESVYNDLFRQFARSIPAAIKIDENVIGKNVPAQIAIFVSSAEDNLREVRNYAGYFQTGYIVLIVLMLLLVAGIVLISRAVKASTRNLGIVFFAAGVIDLVGLLILKGFASEQLAQATGGAPVQIQGWLKQLLSDIATPLQTLCIGLIIGGIVLVVVSFMYRPSRVTG